MAESTDDLHRMVAVLEERMKTMQVEYKTDIARLAEDMAKRETRYTEESAKRETRLLLSMAGLLAVAVAILGILIGLD